MREHIEVWGIRTRVAELKKCIITLSLAEKRQILFLKRAITSSLTFVFYKAGA